MLRDTRQFNLYELRTELELMYLMRFGRQMRLEKSLGDEAVVDRLILAMRADDPEFESLEGANCVSA